MEAKILDVNCIWTMNDFLEKDVAGYSTNSWNGKVVFYEDTGFCIGTVTDKNKENENLPFTHLVIGTLVKDKGIAVLKIPADNNSYDPIDFSMVMSEDKTRYEGEFMALTPWSSYRLGMAYLTYKELENVNKNEVNEVLDKIDMCKNAINNKLQHDLGRRYMNAIEESKDTGESVLAIKSMFDKVVASRKETKTENKTSNKDNEELQA